MKNIIALFCLSLLIGCSKNEDPVLSALISSSNRKQFLEKINKEITIIDTNYRSISTYLPTYKVNFKKLDSIELEIAVNPIFHYGKIRRVSIALEDDDIFNIFTPDSLFIKENKLLLLKYEQWYGIPDTIDFIRFEKKIQFTENDDKYRLSENKATKKKILFWDSDKYEISLGSILLTNGSTTNINYVSKNYESELLTVKDSLKNNLTIASLIDTIPVALVTGVKINPNRSISYELHCRGFSRRDRFDTRKINSIRFDAEIRDQFDKPMFLKKNITSELPVPLGIELIGMLPTANDFTLSSEYSTNSNAYNQLLQVVEYRKNNTIKTVATNFQILLDDGTIIRE